MLRIRSLRVAHLPPLSQEALARAAGLSVKTVRRAERSGECTARTLGRIARALGCGVGELFEEVA